MSGGCLPPSPRPHPPSYLVEGRLKWSGSNATVTKVHENHIQTQSKGVGTIAVRRRSDSKASAPRLPPATTPEAREAQMISLATDLAEKRMRDGTASAQEIVHFMKLGSSRERLEQARLAHENELLKAKKENLDSQKRIEELYENAIGAMLRYQGGESPESEDDYDD